MRVITDKKEIEKTKHYMDLASIVASNSTCKKAQRGAVIIKDDYILGRGYNKPLIEEYCCLREKIHDNSNRELCSGIHAEEMAILKSAIGRLFGATIYHIKLKNGKAVPSGKPSCSNCAKSILFSGIKEIILLHKEGYCAYDAKEFNKLSLEHSLSI